MTLSVHSPPSTDAVMRVPLTDWEYHFDLVACLEYPGLRTFSVSRAGRGLLRLGVEEAVRGLALEEWIEPATVRTLRLHGGKALAEGRVWRGGGLLRTRVGQEIPVRLGLSLHAGECGASPVAVLVAVDDTRVHNLQAVLRNEQLLLRALFEMLPDAIYFKDLEGRYIRGSRSQAGRLGVASPESLIGRTDADFVSADPAGASHGCEQEVLAGSRPSLDREEQRRLPNGLTIWTSTSTFPLRDWREKVVGTFGLSRDVTAQKQAEIERRRMEEQLFHAQKMESIGRLAAGVAHEVNTPTQFISDNTHFLVGAARHLACVVTAYRALRDQARAQPALQEALAVVDAAEADAELDYLLDEIPRTLKQSIDGLERVARIVQSLREFSHPGAPEKAPANINHALETAVAVSRHEWKLVADVVTQLDPDLPEVPCVLDEINQVILNLIINAAHTIADVARDRPERRGCIRIRSRREEAGILVEVEDDGAGIPEAARQHVFEPFFTTKPVGQGTGQGLALVHTMIVNHHGGRVGFTSEVGRGSTFWFRLPLAPPATPPESCARQAPDFAAPKLSLP
jgi:PAS domain S-box-containing protein